MLCVGSGWRLDRPARIGPRVSASRYRQGLESTPEQKFVALKSGPSMFEFKPRSARDLSLRRLVSC